MSVLQLRLPTDPVFFITSRLKMINFRLYVASKTFVSSIYFMILTLLSTSGRIRKEISSGKVQLMSIMTEQAEHMLNVILKNGQKNVFFPFYRLTLHRGIHYLKA